MATVWVLPRRRTDAAIAAVAALVLILTGVLARITRDVPAWEKRVFRWINGAPDALEPMLVVVMQAGTLGVVAVTTVLALLWRRWRLALDLALSGTAAWLLAKVGKSIVGRGRPIEVLAEVIIRGPIDAGNGYPSGHAAVAAALATAASPWLPRRGRWLVWSGVVVTAVARVYVGAHLPLDVVGGIALGVLIGAAVHLLLGAPGATT